MIFIEVVVALHAGSYELCVVNVPIVIGVHYHHGLVDLLISQGPSADTLETFLQFCQSQSAISILVKLAERLPETGDLVFWYPRSDQGESSSLKVNRLLVILQICNDI